MFVRNQWYIAAWDHEVDRKPMARTLCGEPVMLYRRLDRSVVAMQDACPHRLLPLSMGIKDGDSIRCRYHGLLLGSDGRAQEMPVKTEKPHKSVCARLYPVLERHRFVWVWIGDAERADSNLVLNFWPCSDPAWTFDGGYYRIQCDYRLVIDNLMDLTHETYVHQGSIGQQEILETTIDTQAEGDSVIVTRWMSNIDAPTFWRDALKKPGPVDRWQICQFLPPSSVMIDVGVAQVGSGATVELHDQGVRGFVIDGLTPETESTCHYFWGMARNFDVDDVGFTERFRRQQGGVFKEDVVILEAQQHSISANPLLRLKSFSMDAGGVKCRQVIARLLAAQVRSDSSSHNVSP